MRIEEKHAFLGDFIAGAARGEYGIAAFQRPFVWTKQDVEDFMESISKGYPIGSMFLWNVSSLDSSLISKGRIGPVEHAHNVSNLILDGQNRLSSLVWAARSDVAPLNPAFPYSSQELNVFRSGEILVADAEEERIHFVPASASYETRRMPLARVLAYGFGTIVGGTRLLYDEIDQHGIRDSDLGWLLDKVPHWFREKKLVVTSMSNASPEEAMTAFLRICKAGQPISEDDYQKALEWAEVKDNFSLSLR